MKKFSTFMYHRIGDEKKKFEIDIAAFNQHLDLIKSKNISIISLRETKNIKEKPFCVFTFDDGFKSDLWSAETLTASKSTATFFLVKEYIKSPNNKYLQKEEVQIISSLGHEIGVHGKTHDWWTRMPSEKLISDLADTKHWIEDIIGREVVSCSAPGGKINNAVFKAIKDSGNFEFIRNSKPSQNKLMENKFINSVGIENNFSLEVFEKLLLGDRLLYDKLMLKYKVKKVVKGILNK